MVTTPRWAPALVATVTLLVAATGCGSDDPSSAPPLPASPPVGEPAPAPGTGGASLAGFAEITVTVVDAGGRSRTFCLLLADTAPLQQRGLMYVTDPALEGHAGMVFLYAADTDGAFWMRNTRLPLSIAWFDGDGALVSTADMDPCADDEPTCPTYPPAGPYRFAIEVPRGRLGDLGIGPGARVTLGERGCAPAPA